MTNYPSKAQDKKLNDVNRHHINGLLSNTEQTNKKQTPKHITTFERLNMGLEQSLFTLKAIENLRDCTLKAKRTKTLRLTHLINLNSLDNICSLWMCSFFYALCWAIL